MKHIGAFTLLLSLLLLNTAFKFEVKKNEQNKIFMEVDDCEIATRYLNDILAWSKSISEEKPTCSINQNNVSKNKNISCKYEITNCLPNLARELEGLKLEENGPNCWNTALILKKILPKIRFTDASEINFYMGPPLCKQLDNHETRLPGDIGLIRQYIGNTPEEQHAFIYINDDITFQKTGFDSQYPYGLTSNESMFKEFDVSKRTECRSNKIDNNKPNCYANTEYFRCISMDEYLKKKPETEENKKIRKKIVQYEDCLQKRLLANQPLSNEASNGLSASIDAIAEKFTEAIKEDKNFKLKDEKNFYLVSMFMQLYSIKEQLKTTNIDQDLQEKLSKNIMELEYLYEKTAEAQKILESEKKMNTENLSERILKLKEEASQSNKKILIN